MWRHDWFWLVVSRAVIVLTTVANIALATRMLGAREYGMLGLALTAHSLMALFLISPGGQHLNRNLHAWWASGTLFTRLRGFGVYVLLIGGLSALLVAGYWHFQSLKLPWVTALLVAALLLASSWNASIVPSLNLLGWAKAFAVLQILSALVGLAASAALSLWFPTAQSWLAGQMLGLLLAAAVGHVYLWRHRLSPPAPEPASPLVFMDRTSLRAFCVPLAIAAGLMWLQWNSWRPVAQAWLGLEQLGVMLAGFLLAGYIWAVIEGLTQQMLQPHFFSRLETFKSLRDETYRNLVSVLLPVYLVCAAWVLWATPLVTWILPQTGYANAHLYFAWGVFIELARVLTGLLAHAVYLEADASPVLPPYAWGFVAMLVCFGVSRYALPQTASVVLTTLVGAVVVVLAMAVSVRARLRAAGLIRLSRTGLLTLLASVLGWGVWMAADGSGWAWVAWVLALGCLGVLSFHQARQSRSLYQRWIASAAGGEQA